MANKAKAKKATAGMAGMGNDKMYAAICGQYSSNAGGTHDNRPKRERTRSSSKRSAINSGW